MAINITIALYSGKIKLNNAPKDPPKHMTAMLWALVYLNRAKSNSIVIRMDVPTIMGILLNIVFVSNVEM